MNKCNCPDAIANIRGSSKFPDICGRALFFRKSDGVLVVVNVSGLPKNETGFFALHIHEGESCTGEQFADTGTHYNPDNTPHPDHAGDLPSLLSYGGKAYLQVKTDRFSIRDIIGRTILIHFEADDFRTQPSGASGDKIACGEIRKI